MDPWYQRLPARLVTELKAAAESGLRLRFERHPHHIVGWRGTVEVDGRRHFLQILYPPDFPARPPWVRETAALTDEVVDDKQTYHQMVDGSLCLFAMGTGQDSWSPELTVCNVMERYREFRRVADAGGHVNEHGLPLPNAPGLPVSKVLQLTPGQQQVLRLPGAWGWVQAKALGHSQAFVAARVESASGDVGVDQVLTPWSSAGLVRELRLPWIAVECKNWKNLVPNLEALDALLAERVPHEVGRDPVGPVLLVDNSGHQPRMLLLERVELKGLGRVLLRHEVVVEDMPDLLFARVDGAMTGRESLSRWHLVMIGLGSLGGSVALHLAKAGVSRYSLFDPDRVRPENVARHVVGIGGLYLHKSTAIEAQLRDRNPAVEVQRFASSPLWDGSAEACHAFEQILAAPDTILVVTTADEEVERAINELALLYRRPVIYASVIGAGEQGRVQRVLPGDTPCYECISHQQRRHPYRFFRGAMPQAEGLPATVGYRQPGIPGVGLDVEAVAVLAARVILQTLCRLGGGQPDYPDAQGHHLVWTNRRADGFDLPLQVRWERYERDPDCAACGPVRQNTGQLNEIELQRLHDLEAELSDPTRLVLDDIPSISSQSDQTRS